MGPVVETPAEAELQLLTDWSDPDARSRHRKAAIGAIGINIALILGMTFFPEGQTILPEVPEKAQRITPLIIPPDLTQTAPNKGKVSKEFEVREAEAPRKAIQAPQPVPPVPQKKGDKAKQEVAATPPPPPMPPAPRSVPPSIPDAPKVETQQQSAAPDALRNTQQAPPPPQIQPPEKPKLAFESPPPPTRGVPADKRVVPMPGGASIQELAHEATTGAVVGTPQGAIVGDQGVFGAQSSAPGNPMAAFQLKSDPEGVDFTAYLNAILVTIKHNWLAVIPEAARLGQRGTVALQFTVDKSGVVQKIIIAESSGARSLDQAAVTGVSMSNPLLALPNGFKGQQIALQLNFVYR